ncbi:multicopper oxidase domain-containing protein [Streptomyces mirabilis]|uniref:multicopper oxidase domain-containing protein n=1 Tax=Streptomyces mirabilis TaxID=68239 RepID=UPI0036C91D7E
MVRTWAFAGRTPGKELRISVGDQAAATLSNQLPDRTTTSVHWHGIAVRNNMDGLSPATQSAVRAGSAFTYRFRTDAPGTYFFHPHVRNPARPGPVCPADRRGPEGMDGGTARPAQPAPPATTWGT